MGHREILILASLLFTTAFSLMRGQFFSSAYADQVEMVEPAAKQSEEQPASEEVPAPPSPTEVAEPGLESNESNKEIPSGLSVYTSQNRQSVSVGERLLVTTEMVWSQTEHNDITVLKITPPSSESFELINTREATSSRLTEKGIMGTRTIEYTFKATKEGDAHLSPLTVEYVPIGKPEDKRLARGDELSVQIISRSKKITHDVLYILGLIVAVASGVGLIYLLIRLWGRNKRTKQVGVSEDARPEKEAFQKLKDLKPFQISGDLSRFYAELETLLSNYFQRKYRFSYEGKDAEDLIPLARAHGASEELASLLAEHVRIAEKVRFGGYAPTKDEQERTVRGFEKYFKNAVPAEQEETIETVD